MQNNELGLKDALLTGVTPNVDLGSIAVLAFSPVNIAKTMSRIDNHAIIVACLDDRRVATGDFCGKTVLECNEAQSLQYMASLYRF